MDDAVIGNEIDGLKDKIEKAGMSPEAKERCVSELGKLRMMPPMSAEATVVRNYLDWLLSVPWKKKTKVNEDLNKAEGILKKIIMV